MRVKAAVSFARCIVAYKDTLDSLRGEFVSFSGRDMDKCSGSKNFEVRDIWFGAEIQFFWSRMGSSLTRKTVVKVCCGGNGLRP